MQLTEYEALEAYARMMNTLSVEPIRSLLDECFVYESQAVFQPIESKQAFLDYMIPKLQTIARANATVYAEMGTVEAYGKKLGPICSCSSGRPKTYFGSTHAPRRVDRSTLFAAPGPASSHAMSTALLPKPTTTTRRSRRSWGSVGST